MKLLALVLLLSVFSSLTLTEVVNSFKQSCPSFFIRNPHNGSEIIIPTIFPGHQYKTICQRWKNAYRFATVYDTVRRIPVYSAYKFLHQGQTKRSDEWKIEPQLEDIEEYKKKTEMMDSPVKETTVRNIIKQAVNLDYKNCNDNNGIRYTRGHVFPRSFAANQDQADSTFTLTNIAPQTQNSNGAWEQQVETRMINEIKNICRVDQNHQVYIVTGVVPGNNWIPITRGGKKYKDGINIPSHFWSAFCCTDRNNIRKLTSKAYIAELENFRVRTPTIDNLNERLTKLYNRIFSVFPRLPVGKIQPLF
ncbi:endonuclease domain-containing 1 protein-like [Ictalurus furcatus]|uniref:endonuclease domain-containing 1 protein-like n=1 Tax=Ictalurus furcatus TaxID=66913 RepID=UPI00234FE752|nr:endonuclease domain-containing 1 protein-like [Ictalurus furcatus]XP_053494768.1 endonuclease domain-containing 1 protein-like [Ictalurus furcatus]